MAAREEVGQVGQQRGGLLGAESGDYVLTALSPQAAEQIYPPGIVYRGLLSLRIRAAPPDYDADR